ncbi:MAG: hypothetical protein ABDH28_02270 [Brevinematia bacterium]
MKYKSFLLAYLALLLLVLGCNFRINLYETLEPSNTNKVFDISPPYVEIIFPTNSSVLSGLVLIVGKTEDESGAITYLEVRGVSYSFTNQTFWEAEVNTYDFTNGMLEIGAYARDSLGNTSSRRVVTCWISNELMLSVLPQGFVVTNCDFYFDISLTATNYTSLKVFTNSSLVMATNGVTNLKFLITSDLFDENRTNSISVVVDDKITNVREFLFDFSPPYLSFLIGSNSYLYGASFSIPIEVIDSNKTFVYLGCGNVTNEYIFENFGTNSLVLNTYVLSNGTNVLRMWAKDMGGNISQVCFLPVVVANYFRYELNRVSARNYYFINSELSLDRVRLFFTDSVFSSLFVAKEENNFSRERITPGSLNILSTGKIRSISLDSKFLVGYIREDQALIIRTNLNADLTNFYQLANLGSVEDFDFTRVSNKCLVIRVKTNFTLLVTDVSNNFTNFVTNLGGSFKVKSERYPALERVLFSVYNSDKVSVFTNFGVLFETNVGGTEKVGVVSFPSGSLHFAFAKTNELRIVTFTNNSFHTNFSFSTTNTIYDLAGIRYFNHSLWAVVESDGLGSAFVRIVEVSDSGVLRDQIIDSRIFLPSHVGGFEDISIIYDGVVRVFVPSTWEGYGSIVMFMGL